MPHSDFRTKYLAKPNVAKTVRSCLVAAMMAVGQLAASSASGQSQSAPVSASQGLKELLPAETPTELLDALNRFPETWEDWTGSVTSQLNALYSETPSDIAGQRAALGRLKVKLNTIDRALTDSQYESIRDQLQSLRAALIKRIDMLDAVLDTLTDRETASYANSARQQLLTTATAVDAYLDWAVNGDKWKTFLLTNEVRGALSSATDSSALLTQMKKSAQNLRFAQSSTTPAVRDFSANSAFRNYLRDLDRAIAALELQSSGPNWGDIRNEIKQLIEGLEGFEDTELLSSAGQVRATYDRLRSLTPDGGDRFTRVLRQYYFNSNFQALVSEGFLNRVMSTSRVDSGGVRDYILGADVYGSQTTASKSSVSLVPDSAAAHLQIQLSGEVSNNTEAYASKAVIYSTGSHSFNGSKDVIFDGTTFSTQPAAINVAASNQPVGASTQADGIPLLGGIARRMALRAADRNRPEAEAIAAERVDSRVEPEFNDNVDRAFADLNVDLRDKVTRPLQSEHIYPDYISASSTDLDLTLSTRLMPTGKLGGGPPPLQAVGPEDMVVSFHESLINNTLDELPIAGKSMTEPEFEKLVKDKINKLIPRLNLTERATAKSEADEPKRIIFADNDPLRVKFENGTLLLMVRAGFERDAEHGGNIPPQVVTIPWRISVVGQEIVLTRADISVEPVKATTSVAQQVVMAGVIKSRLAKSFPDTSKKASTFNVDRTDKTPLHFSVLEMTLRSGWLSVRATAVPQ